MTAIIEGMARAAYNRPWYDGNQEDRWEQENDDEHKQELMNDMKAALLWAADNVSDAMVDAFCAVYMEQEGCDWKEGLSAAVRAAVDRTENSV